MIIRSPEPEVKIVVDRDPVKTSFEEWARPGMQHHFRQTFSHLFAAPRELILFT